VVCQDKHSSLVRVSVCDESKGLKTLMAGLNAIELFSLSRLEHFTGGRLLALRANIRLGFKKGFKTLTVRGQCYKTFLSVIYVFSHKARVFIRPVCKSLPGRNALAYYEKS
jgi:hypothetical protein